jgi:hypothetical protein
MEHIFEQAKCVVCCEDIIHPDKKTTSNLLETLDDMPNPSYLALVHDPQYELLRVKKSRVCIKKLCKETKKVAQHLTLLMKLQGKNKPITKHLPCTANVTDEDHVKSTMTLDDSEAMLLFVAWGSDEDLKYITTFPQILSINAPYGTN